MINTTFAAPTAQNMIRMTESVVQAENVTILVLEANNGVQRLSNVFARATWKPMAMATAALLVRCWMKTKIVQHHALLKIAAHIHTLQTRGTLKSATSVAIKARAINVNPATPIPAENAYCLQAVR